MVTRSRSFILKPRFEGISADPDNCLIKIDIGAGHEAGFIAREIEAGARHLLRVYEAPKGPVLHGVFQPAILRAVIDAHHALLARCMHPADIEAVDPDAMLHKGMREIAREGRQCALRRGIGRKERLPAMGGHGLDVYDRARDLLARHNGHGILCEEERRADIHREEFVKPLDRGVEDRAAIGEPRRIHEDIHAAKLVIRRGNHRAHILHLGEVGLREDRGRALPREFVPDARAPRCIPPGEAEPRRARRREGARDGLAKPLRRASHHSDLAGKAAPACRHEFFPATARLPAEILLGRALPESGSNSSLPEKSQRAGLPAGDVIVIGLGVIGAGRIGRIHAGNVAAHAGAKLVSVSDALPAAAESLAAELGTKAVSREAMLADASISGVLICSPTDTHADFIEEAVKAGKAVFCEKPVDLSSDRIRACLKTVAASGKPLMIGFNRRFDPNFAEAKKRLVAGAIGKIEMVTILSRDPGPPPVEYVKRSGGLFRDMMIHDLDMARFLLGEDPVEVHAVGSCLVDQAIGQAGDVDTAAVLLKTASGKIAQISNSRRASYGYDQRFEVHGEKGWCARRTCR